MSNDPLPFFLINGLCFLVAWSLARGIPFYRQLLAEAPVDRVTMVDGLRGWLALGVFFTHGTVMRTYVIEGRWGDPGAWFYGMTGQIGVSLFFMITGFLFWGRVIRRPGPLDAVALYHSRLRRIVPMYLVSVLLSLGVVAVLSDFQAQVSLIELLRQLRAWFSFGFLVAGEINGVREAHAINAVYWTLAFEWCFYLALPLLAVLGRSRLHWLALGIALLYALQAPVTLNFIAGGLLAQVRQQPWLGTRLQSPWLTPLPLAALGGVLAFPSAYSLLPVGLLSLFLLFVVGGNSLFGLLASTGARLLGSISYSLYLLHCIVLFCVMRGVNTWRPLASLSWGEYWSVMALAATAIVLLSALTYRYVEHPALTAADHPWRERTTAGPLLRHTA